MANSGDLRPNIHQTAKAPVSGRGAFCLYFPRKCAIVSKTVSDDLLGGYMRSLFRDMMKWPRFLLAFMLFAAAGYMVLE